MSRQNLKNSDRVCVVPGLILARKNRAWSQRDLAKRAGVMPAAICFFERGERCPSVENLLRLATTLGVSTDFLLGRDSHQIGAGPKVTRLLDLAGCVEGRDLDLLLALADTMSKSGR